MKYVLLTAVEPKRSTVLIGALVCLMLELSLAMVLLMALRF
jgi:hypothetical protein